MDYRAGQRVKDRHGNTGVIVSGADLHNVEVRYDNEGGTGVYCVVETCDFVDRLTELESEGTPVSEGKALNHKMTVKERWALRRVLFREKWFWQGCLDCVGSILPPVVAANCITAVLIPACVGLDAIWLAILIAISLVSTNMVLVVMFVCLCGFFRPEQFYVFREEGGENEQATE
jgi:hypothetical protein